MRCEAVPISFLDEDGRYGHHDLARNALFLTIALVVTAVAATAAVGFAAVGAFVFEKPITAIEGAILPTEGAMDVPGFDYVTQRVAAARVPWETFEIAPSMDVSLSLVFAAGVVLIVGQLYKAAIDLQSDQDLTV